MATSKLNDGTPKGPSFSGEFSIELRQNSNLLPQARLVLDALLPDQRSRIVTRFEAREVEAGKFFIDTDLDWASAIKDYRRLRGEPGALLGAADILSRIQEGYVDVGLAARFGTELLTSELQEKLVAYRVRQLMQSKVRSDEEIAVFNEKILGDAFALRDAINSNARTFSDFLDVMDKAQRFKAMLRGANPDVGLISTYANEVKKGSWMESLPSRAVRFGLFTVAGFGLEMVLPTGLGTAAGVAVNSVDQFILDKLFKGWRPNTFVEDELLPFVRENIGKA